MNVKFLLQNAVCTGMICFCLTLVAETSHVAAGDCHGACHISEGCGTCRKSATCGGTAESCRSGCKSCGNLTKGCDACDSGDEQVFVITDPWNETSVEVVEGRSIVLRFENGVVASESATSNVGKVKFVANDSNKEIRLLGVSQGVVKYIVTDENTNRYTVNVTVTRSKWLNDTRARITGLSGGGDAVIWVKFPSLPELGNRRPNVSINFTEYEWAGTVRSFRTRIPDSGQRRYYVTASNGPGYPSDLVPVGLGWDAGRRSHYVDLTPGMTADILFIDQNPKAEIDRVSALDAKLTKRIDALEAELSLVKARVDTVERTAESNSDRLKSLSAAVWPGNSSDLIYHWSKGDRGSVVGRGKAKIDKHGAMQLSGGAYLLPAEVNAKLLEVCKRSGELSIEVVLKTSNTSQSGPARIVSFSQDANLRNFTLGQEGETSGSKGDNLVLRLRTAKNDHNGTNPQVKLGKIVP